MLSKSFPDGLGYPVLAECTCICSIPTCIVDAGGSDVILIVLRQMCYNRYTGIIMY